MAIFRIDIERALDELVSQEEGMRFQGLAVVLGKRRWPELIARQRKKDSGLDAYAGSSLTQERYGKGLAASITPEWKKVIGDARTAKENFPDLKFLLFVTPAKIGNAARTRWEEDLRQELGIELSIIEREEIITLMLMPENVSLCANFLNIASEAEPRVSVLISKAKRAADAVISAWGRRSKGHPLIELTAERLGSMGEKTDEVLSLEQIDQALWQSQRIVLEAPAGRGKTTTLIQLAERPRIAGIPFVVELPAWTSSRKEILDYIVGIPSFREEGLTASDLARIQQVEPFFFLLNGWNEVAESNSGEANEALRELERNFPSAGIIVATRTHHLTPPLPGALRLRLMRLRRVQRTTYLNQRLGSKSAALRAIIDADRSLDELTRTPFVLAEVAALAEAGAEVPSTKEGILSEVLRLHEQRDEHRNSLQSAPIFGQQEHYLKALAAEMTRRGSAALPQADARALVAGVAKDLSEKGQIDAVGAPAILATLTAHHVLERVEYPEDTFQFEHQQLQERYATIDIRTQLLSLSADDKQAVERFKATYLNNPDWAEPLRMIAEGFSASDDLGTSAGSDLVRLALAIDPVFAGELARLCGAAVWDKVRGVVGDRLRSILSNNDDGWRQYAVAAMLATGSGDFSDVLIPLLSSDDQQIRLRTYRLWPDFQVSSLGPKWRQTVSAWPEAAREDFVSELLHHRHDTEVAAFAAEDSSASVKKAAVSGLTWLGYDDLAVRVFESMDAQTFEEVVRRNPDFIPQVLRSRSIAALHSYLDRAPDHVTRLGAARALIELGETGLEDVIKDAMSFFTKSDLRSLLPSFLDPVLERLSSVDPNWTNEWIVTRIAEGLAFASSTWMTYVTRVPAVLVEKYLNSLETEDHGHTPIDGMIAVVAAQADQYLAARVFVRLRDLQSEADSDPRKLELHWHLTRQLQALMRQLPSDIVADGILSVARKDDSLDIKAAADLLSSVARPDAEPMAFADESRRRLRDYLVSAIPAVLQQDDYTGVEKANLASSIAQVGQPEDMPHLMSLIRADIDRVRRGQNARSAGDRGPIANGATMRYSGWHVQAVLRLDRDGAAAVLMELLGEPEYCLDAAAAMARDYLPGRQERPFRRLFRPELIWAAREASPVDLAGDNRRAQYASALHAEVARLLNESLDGKPVRGIKEVAKALAAVDGRRAAPIVLEALALPAGFDEYVRVEALQRLLMAGAVLPVAAVISHVDAVVERAGEWPQDSARNLIAQALELCPFVDDPVTGVAKIREVLGKRKLYGSEIDGVISSLGQSRSEAAADLLRELSSDPQTFRQCETSFITAFAALDSATSSALLMRFVDPDLDAIDQRPRQHYDRDGVVSSLGELAQRVTEVRVRLMDLAERDLPEPARSIVSRVMQWLRSPDALTASLNLIDDSKSPQVPYGVWEQLRDGFLERRPYGDGGNSYTEHAQASNQLRATLFRMASDDEKRRKSASSLLAHIELWRLEYGRPTEEPRHPSLGLDRPWPPEPSEPAKPVCSAE